MWMCAHLPTPLLTHAAHGTGGIEVAVFSKSKFPTEHGDDAGQLSEHLLDSFPSARSNDASKEQVDVMVEWIKSMLQQPVRERARDVQTSSDPQIGTHKMCITRRFMQTCAYIY